MLISCDHKTKAWNTMDKVESLINSHPDSAMTILSSIEKGNLGDDEEKARYALLMSMALDKNYIDTTSFAVLQPAIDYYLSKGSADERLRTLYYQGRIFMNKSDFDMAMQSFLKANDFKNECRDTLTYANMLVAQSILNYSSYQMEDYVSNNLIAADLYDKLNNDNYRQSSLIKALDGSIALENKQLSDSLLTVVDSLSAIVPESQEEIALVRQTYLITYEPNNVVAAMLDTISDYALLGDASKLNIAIGYLKLNQYKKAHDIFKLIDSSSELVKSFRYLQYRPEILEANGNYKEALAAYKTYFNATNKEKSKIYYQKTTVAEGVHNLKLKNIQEIQHKNKIIWLSVCSILLLLLVIGVISYLYRLGKMKRILAEKEQHQLKLKNASLQNQNSILELEKQTAKLENEKQHLAGENMKLRISQLESENEQLKVLSEKDELPDDVKEVIKERISILNALFAANILDKEPAATAYVDLVKHEISDKKKFMNSNRLAFKVSHPMFIKYLEDHNLTEYEINYICLYAIGLKGKEVGNYMELRRHYNISSDIRRKLGINEHETNISIYIRKLLKQL
jgi:Tfp pilus assembly protein PilO